MLVMLYLFQNLVTYSYQKYLLPGYIMLPLSSWKTAIKGWSLNLDK